MRLLPAAVLSALLAVGLFACDACEPSAPTTSSVRRGAPGAAEPVIPTTSDTPAKTAQRTDRVPEVLSTPRAPTPGSAPVAEPTDGGLPSDGGTPPHDDHALAVAVESQARSLVSCFPTSLSSLPEVSINFQISVTGYVTRSDVSSAGLDRDVQSCVARAAQTIRFPEQTASRSYAYQLRLRRVDAGPPGPTPPPSGPAPSPSAPAPPSPAPPAPR